MPRGWGWDSGGGWPGWDSGDIRLRSPWLGPATWQQSGAGVSPQFGAADSSPTGGIFGRLTSRLGSQVRGFQSPGQEDAILRQMRDMALADAAARQRGARSTARVSAPNDPSLASWADLNALVGGQSDVSRGLMGAAYGRLSEKDRRGWEEYMLRLRTKLEEDAMRRANAGGFLGELGQFGGDILGSWLSPGGWFKGK